MQVRSAGMWRSVSTYLPTPVSICAFVPVKLAKQVRYICIRSAAQGIRRSRSACGGGGGVLRVSGLKLLVYAALSSHSACVRGGGVLRA